MFVTFGATFFGVIASFLLWYGGQWWLKRRHDQLAVKHIVRETKDEIAVNINVLTQLVRDVSKMMVEGNMPIFIPHRMNLPKYSYLTYSGELRLLDAGKQRWILVAGQISETFNNFIDNTELLLALTLGLPNGLKLATHRIEGLINQAKDNAKNLNKILGILEGTVENNQG